VHVGDAKGVAHSVPLGLVLPALGVYSDSRASASAACAHSRRGALYVLRSCLLRKCDVAGLSFQQRIGFAQGAQGACLRIQRMSEGAKACISDAVCAAARILSTDRNAPPGRNRACGRGSPVALPLAILHCLPFLTWPAAQPAACSHWGCLGRRLPGGLQAPEPDPTCLQQQQQGRESDGDTASGVWCVQDLQYRDHVQKMTAGWARTLLVVRCILQHQETGTSYIKDTTLTQGQKAPVLV
jgi:hypothetical protein